MGDEREFMPFRTGIQPPANEADFERLCLRILKAYWKCETLELFGHRGEPQFGIDILDMSGADPLKAAQCKRYDPSKTLPPADIISEVNAAREFQPSIGVYALMTTAKVSVAAQKTIMEINRRHREEGRFLVELFTWERIEDLLNEHSAVRDSEYKTLSSEVSLKVEEGLGQLTARLMELTESPGHYTSDALHAEIDEARNLIQAGDFQTGRFLLQRLRTRRWGTMEDRHRFRILSNIAVAHFREQDFSRAGELFWESASFEDSVQGAENKAFAHYISLPRDDAFGRIDELRKEFSDSIRITSLWIGLAPAGRTAADIRGLLSAVQLATPEVMTALAARALTECNFELCQQLASKSVELRPEWSAPQILKARSFVMQAVRPSLEPLISTDQLHRAKEMFTKGLELAARENDRPAQVECLLERSHICLLLGDAAGADTDTQHAAALMPEEQAVLRAVAEMNLRHGHVEDGIVGLRAALGRGYRPDIALSLANSLRAHGSTAEIDEAITLLFQLVATTDHVAPGGREFVASVLLEMLAVRERWTDAEGVCEILRNRDVSGALVSAYMARISYMKGEIDGANQFADTALASLTGDAPDAEIRWVAHMLSDLKRYADALPLWRRLGSSTALTTDTKALLNCAMHLQQHDLIIDVCAGLRRHGVIDRELVLFEVQVLEQYDVERAISALREYLEQNPDDRGVRLRLSVIGLTWNRPEITDARPRSMPPVADVDVRVGLTAVQVMKFGGFPDEALRYAYELLRRHFGDIQAHRAMITSLNPAGTPPVIPKFEEVVVGTAVSYIEEGEAQVKWAIIEDCPEPELARSEYSPEHPLARALMSKKIGERAVLAHGAVADRTATVREILSKYVFRYQDCMVNWQLRFPDSHSLESVQVMQISKDGKEEFDLSRVIASTHQRAADVKRLTELYGSENVPIHMIGAVQGKSTVETTLYLACDEETQVFCCAGTAEERDQALASLEVSNTWIIESSAIAAIFLLDFQDLLTRLPVSLVLSQGVLAELNEMLRNESLFKGEGGILTTVAGRVVMIPVTATEREERHRLLASRINKLTSACKIVGCMEVAKLDAMRRDDMTKAFGQAGMESIVLASQPGHLVWTDDCRLAGFARTEYGSKSVWSQVVMQWAAAKGYISQKDFLTGTARLIGYRYLFTSPSTPALVAAAELAEWNATSWPFRAAIEQLGSETIQIRDAAALGLSIIIEVYRQVILDEKRRSAIRAVLDQLANRSGGVSVVKEIRRAIPRVFGLNAIGAADAVATVESWLRSRAVQVGV